MAESTALVPTLFYPPVPSGTGALFTFGESSRRPMPLEQKMCTVAPEPDDGLTYSEGGGLVADSRIGTRVNIYV
jgi:hypothetical protein